MPETPLSHLLPLMKRRPPGKMLIVRLQWLAQPWQVVGMALC